MISREEAIAYFKRHLDLYCVEGISRESEEMAIKALKQELCEDCISKQAVLEQIDQWAGSREYLFTNATHYLTKRIQDLPPVTPQLKTGHWIVEVWNNKERHTCSACQRVVDYEPCYHYCPYCGAKLEEKRGNKGMYIACKKCKYNCDGECDFYYIGSGNEIDMPCYREKELIKKATDNFLQAFVGAESEVEE